MRKKKIRLLPRLQSKMEKRFRDFLTFSTFGAGASSRPLKREHNQGRRAGQAGLSPTAPEIRHKRILKRSAEGELPELSHPSDFQPNAQNASEEPSTSG